MQDIKKIVGIAAISISVLGFVLLFVFMVSNKYNLQQTNPEGGQNFTGLGITLIIALAIGLITIIYIVIKKLSGQKKDISKQIIFPPESTGALKNAIITQYVKKNIIRGQIDDKGVLISANHLDYEWGSHATYNDSYYDIPGYNFAKFLTIKLTLKNWRAPSNYLGTHTLNIPMITASKIASEDYDMLIRGYGITISRNKSVFPQSIDRVERLAQQRQINIEELDDIDLLRQKEQSPETKALSELTDEIKEDRQDRAEQFAVTQDT